MDGSSRHHRGEWMVDHRRHWRWIEARTILIRSAAEEYLGKTEDISVGGVQMKLAEADVAPGETVECSLVFGARVVDLSGTVVYTVPGPDQVSLGLAFAELPPPTADFLAETYPPGPA